MGWRPTTGNKLSIVTILVAVHAGAALELVTAAHLGPGVGADPVHLLRDVLHAVDPATPEELDQGAGRGRLQLHRMISRGRGRGQTFFCLILIPVVHSRFVSGSGRWGFLLLIALID